MSNKRDKAKRLQEAAREEYIGQMVSYWDKQIPSRYQGRTINGDLITDKWNGRINRGGLLQLRQYLEEPTTFLILRGTAGLGKSTLASTLVRHMVEQGAGYGYYKSLPGLLQEFSFPDRNYEDPVRTCSRVDILLIDDVGASTEHISAHQKRSLWQVLDSRWANELPTILTTNMSISSNSDGTGLIDWLGDSAWDRLQSSLTVIEFHGESFRRTASDLL